MPRKKKTKFCFIVLTLSIAFTALLASGLVIVQTSGRTVIEIDIQQNRNLILFSDYGEPPQFAIWLENVKSGDVKTIFVTHRSGTGDWEGKLECPDALPAWFSAYKKEMNTTSLPNQKKHAPIAITGATPTAGHFRIRAEVEPQSKWDCFIEMNLAGDYNSAYTRYASDSMIEDLHGSGQPSLIFKANIDAHCGFEEKAQLIGYYDTQQEAIKPLTEDITSAKHVFEDIRVCVMKPKPYFIKPRQHDPLEPVHNNNLSR